MSESHIIFIGFKHVGKSAVARKLAKALNKTLIDLDTEVEQAFRKQYHKKLSCRRIMQQRGPEFFRELETATLQNIIDYPSGVIALGGGTPLIASNQLLIKPHVVIHVTAAPDVVYKRIMKKGLPAFFSSQEDPLVTFKRLWQERETIYTSLTPYHVDNTNSLAEAVTQTLAYIHRNS